MHRGGIPAKQIVLKTGCDSTTDTAILVLRRNQVHTPQKPIYTKKIMKNYTLYFCIAF